MVRMRIINVNFITYSHIFLETVKKQNGTIVGLVSEIKLMLVNTMTAAQTSLKYSELFPIPSIDKLNEIENETSDETKKHEIVRNSFEVHTYIHNRQMTTACFVQG